MMVDPNKCICGIGHWDNATCPVHPPDWAAIDAQYPMTPGRYPGDRSHRTPTPDGE